MNFFLHITGLAKVHFLGFLWVGDAITYFEFVYLPVVILLMIVATLFLKQKDRKLKRSYQEQAYYPTEIARPKGSSVAMPSGTTESREHPIRVLDSSPVDEAAFPAQTSMKDFPKQIPA